MLKTILIAIFCLLAESSLKTQIDTLVEALRGKKVAFLTNPTSVDQNLQPLFNRLIRENITIKCFFAAEHGLRGDQQAGSGDQDYIDKQTGIQVYSLYGVRKAPLAEQLLGIDLFLYDIQDVGTRFYTYIWTLTYTMEKLKQLNISLYVFDRPNPLGRKVEGCPLELDAGLIGRVLPGQTYSIPTRYGLTIGELSIYLNRYIGLQNIHVIKMPEYRQIEPAEWIPSSPNMPTLSTVHVYPGFGIFEGTDISQGRGTTRPFEITGHASIRAHQLISYLQKQKINCSGCKFRETYFSPTFSKFQGKTCGGIQVHVSNATEFHSVEMGLHLLKGYISLIDGIKISSGIDKLFGILGFSELIRTKSVQQILQKCNHNKNQYESEYKQFWLYQNIEKKPLLIDF